VTRASDDPRLRLRIDDTDDGKQVDSLKEAIPEASASLEWIISRRFCISQKGLVVIVPPCSKANDVVALIYGAAYLFVLRHAGETGRMQVVGMCKVGGIDALEDLDKIFKSEELKVEEILLV